MVTQDTILWSGDGKGGGSRVGIAAMIVNVFLVLLRHQVLIHVTHIMFNPHCCDYSHFTG